MEKDKKKMTGSELFDEIQETIMIVGALSLWGGFEFLCLTNSEVAGSVNVGITRTALITIVTNLFTFKFTKSLPRGGQGKDNGENQ